MPGRGSSIGERWGSQAMVAFAQVLIGGKGLAGAEVARHVAEPGAGGTTMRVRGHGRDPTRGAQDEAGRHWDRRRRPAAGTPSGGAPQAVRRDDRGGSYRPDGAPGI